MRHSKGHVLSLPKEEAIKYLYEEIEELERKLRELEDRISDVKQ